MTPDERSAANEIIARAIGGRLAETNVNGRPLWYFPGNTVPNLFDIFATDDAGSAARERAEEWLLSRGWAFAVNEKSATGPFVIWASAPITGADLRDDDDKQGAGATLGEARANAIAAAFRALKEGVRCRTREQMP